VAALTGRTIVVTRARSQSSRLIATLESIGADVIEVPVIATEVSADGGAALRDALARASTYEWIVVTSPNGVAAVVDGCDGDLTGLRSTRFAVVGPATADALRERGLVAALVPERFVAEGLLEAFPAPTGDGRLLVAQADAARPVLVDGLRAAGWRVDAVIAYRTLAAAVDDDQHVAIARADAITFTSASTVENLVAAVGVDAVPSVVVSIGPVTSAAAREHGLTVSAEADPHTVDGLVAALVSVFA
jgi:uroporphyrinogen III methyltransferase/synthase